MLIIHHKQRIARKATLYTQGGGCTANVPECVLVVSTCTATCIVEPHIAFYCDLATTIDVGILIIYTLNINNISLSVQRTIDKKAMASRVPLKILYSPNCTKNHTYQIW